jgi:toxin CcdB
LLEELETTVVIPLCPAASVGGIAITKIWPVLKTNDKNYIALTQQPAGIDKKSLGKEVCNLSNYRSEVIAALDFLVSGI